MGSSGAGGGGPGSDRRKQCGCLGCVRVHVCQRLERPEVSGAGSVGPYAAAAAAARRETAAAVADGLNQRLGSNGVADAR